MNKFNLMGSISIFSLDVLKPLGHKHILEHELEGFGIRLNKKPPNIYFKQKEKGKEEKDYILISESNFVTFLQNCSWESELQIVYKCSIRIRAEINREIKITPKKVVWRYQFKYPNQNLIKS